MTHTTDAQKKMRKRMNKYIQCKECDMTFDSFSHMGAHGHGGSGGGGGNRSEQTIMEESIRKMFTEYKENPKTNYSDKDRFFIDYCMEIFNSELDALAQEVEKMKGTAKNHEWEQVRRQAWGYDEAISQVLQIIRERGNHENKKD